MSKLEFAQGTVHKYLAYKDGVNKLIMKRKDESFYALSIEGPKEDHLIPGKECVWTQVDKGKHPNVNIDEYGGEIKHYYINKLNKTTIDAKGEVTKTPDLVEVKQEEMARSTTEHAAWILGIAAMLKLGSTPEYEGKTMEEISKDVVKCSSIIIDSCRKDIEVLMASIAKKIKEIQI